MPLEDRRHPRSSAGEDRDHASALRRGTPGEEPHGPAEWAEASSTRRTLTRREFLATFQFSQGSLATQGHLFAYLKILHPELAMTATDQDWLLAVCLRPAQALIQDRRRHPRRRADEARDALDAALREAAAILNAPPQDQRDAIRRLARDVVQGDLRYLRRPGGRDYQREATAHFDPYKDPWRSDLCYFGLLGRTTGFADFDALFAEIAAYWRAQAALGDLASCPLAALDEAREVVDSFNAHHAGISGLPGVPLAL